MLRRGMWAHRFPGSGGKVGEHLGRALLPGSSSRTGIQSTGSTGRWGLDLLDRYVKFVKERTEVEQAYAKQLR